MVCVKHPSSKLPCGEENKIRDKRIQTSTQYFVEFVLLQVNFMVLVVYTHIKVLRLFCKEWFHWDCVNNVVVPVHRSVTARCWWLPGGGAGGCWWMAGGYMRLQRPHCWWQLGHWCTTSLHASMQNGIRQQPSQQLQQTREACSMQQQYPTTHSYRFFVTSKLKLQAWLV